MKFKIKSALLALSGAALLANPAMGAVNLGPGELALVFYKTTGSGLSTVVDPDTYVFNLGAANLYRENTLWNVSVSTVNPGISSSNIGTDLVAAFGANWYNSSTLTPTGSQVRWMVVGSVSATESALNGDPTGTSYYSRARSNFNTIPLGPLLGDSERGSLLNSLSGFRAGTNGATQTVGDNTSGAFISTTSVNSIEEYVPGPGGEPLDYFGTGLDPRQAFGSGTIANSPGIGVKEGALNLFRFINTTAGADLTGGPLSPLAEVGKGQYIGTLNIDSLGNLSIIPEPSSSLLGLAGGLALCFRRRRNA